ncbi:MAG: DUF1329 domain-containing protein [Burkholderiaceae bacterium]
MKQTLLFSAVLTSLAMLPLATQAGVSADEAAKLKTTLTPLGAERAGNKEGTIPAWDGVPLKMPAGYKSGDPRPNPFPGEKPTLSITAANMAQYADKLSDGSKALLKKYPSYRLDVYPTHRTGIAPQWVYDNTAKNATRAKLLEGGQGVEGAYGGIPFPVVKDANEAIWNHRLAWTGNNVTSTIRVFMVTADGKRTMASAGNQTWRFPYYDADGSLDKFEGYYTLGKFLATGPGYKAGEAILAHETVDPNKHARNLWQYLVGQRRVRKAPSIAYDTPDAVTSGIGLADEAFNLFGPIDKHELKLLGKRELYIPYNNTMAAQVKVDELVTPNHLNPTQVRWELHRVWEIDATLKAGQRHVVSKRKYYLDEDTWQIITFDGWDANGQLWRTNFTLTMLAPDVPALIGHHMWGGYDLQTGAYYLNMAPNELASSYKQLPPIPATFFSPEALASEGAR